MTFARLLAAALGADIPGAPPEPWSAPDALRASWEAHLARVRAEAPQAVIEDGGETVYTRALSPGCQACKAGSWDCLFLTTDCNLACSFCCSPGKTGGRAALSALGGDLAELVEALRIAQPDGISFSGGEAFLEFERLRRLVTVIRREFPTAYLWVYTNGLLAGGEMLAELGQIGLDEIRFNMAASGYTHPLAMEHLSQAGRYIEAVTVEIPAIPAHAGQLLAALPEWSRAGVQYLNLHELMYEPGSPSAAFPGPRETLTTPDGHVTEYHPHSRMLVLEVMREAAAQQLPLAVNDCSMQNKLRQVRGRKALLGRLAQGRPGSAETLGPGGLLSTICAFDEQGQRVFLRPDQYEAARRQYPGWHFARLWREPPMSVFSQTGWLWYEEIPADR